MTHMSSTNQTVPAGVPAKTLSAPVSLQGIGLHSGRSINLTLSPDNDARGIVFVRTDLPQRPEIAITDVDAQAAPFRTALRKGAADVQTVEHLLAAFSALGVTHGRVELDGPEVPGMDGSSQNFVEALQRAGLTAIDGRMVAPLVIREELTLEEGIAKVTARPAPGATTLSVHYTLHYPGHALAQGEYEFELSAASFVREIAPARTFAIKPDAEAMRAAGLGKGATLQNTVIIDGDRAIETELRFANEPVRHKILDLIGDLYVLGRPVYGRIEAKCSGHKLNRELARKLSAKRA